MRTFYYCLKHFLQTAGLKHWIQEELPFFYFKKYLYYHIVGTKFPVQSSFHNFGDFTEWSIKTNLTLTSLYTPLNHTLSLPLKASYSLTPNPLITRPLYYALARIWQFSLRPQHTRTSEAVQTWKGRECVLFSPDVLCEVSIGVAYSGIYSN